MSDLSRRNLLVRAPAAAVATLPMAVAVPAKAAGSPELHALWNERRDLRAVALANDAKCQAAEAALPWWARVGGSQIDFDGNAGGPDSHEPAIINARRPRFKGTWCRLRPSVKDLRWDYDYSIAHDFEKQGRATYRAALREYATRKRAQFAEFEKVNLPALNQEADAIVTRMCAVSDKIVEHPHYCADAIAARLLIGFASVASSERTTRGNLYGISDTLVMLRPHLTGNIAADVADLLDNPNTPVTERMAWL